MTPDRREELRRCDDACYRTRTSRDINELKERIKALESLLARAGDKLNNYDSDYNPENAEVDQLIAEIDAILPDTEGKKDVTT